MVMTNMSHEWTERTLSEECVFYVEIIGVYVNTILLEYALMIGV